MIVLHRPPHLRGGTRRIHLGRGIDELGLLLGKLAQTDFQKFARRRVDQFLGAIAGFDDWRYRPDNCRWPPARPAFRDRVDTPPTALAPSPCASVSASRAAASLPAKAKGTSCCSNQPRRPASQWPVPRILWAGTARWRAPPPSSRGTPFNLLLDALHAHRGGRGFPADEIVDTVGYGGDVDHGVTRPGAHLT